MATKSKTSSSVPAPSDFLLAAESRKKTIPIVVVAEGRKLSDLPDLTDAQRSWLKAVDWSPKAGAHIALPNDRNRLASILFAIDENEEPGSLAWFMGGLSQKLPEGDYHIEGKLQESHLAVLSWVLSSYCYRRYKSDQEVKYSRLKVPHNVPFEDLKKISEAVYLGRDLINCPANDLGPAELEEAVRDVARRTRAKVAICRGDNLLGKNFPLIHAVGRASDRLPRLIDLNWIAKTKTRKLPTVTLVGKGICFDTGGLNIKPGNAMALMKKDMGGAATALALARMIMATDLPCRLRLLIPAADNNISANAFRPGDVCQSRKGLTVEIGNTDAEGRLVLADALTLADEDAPDYLFNFATLTGAARIALGPDLPAFYSTDDDFANALFKAGTAVSDPLWRMPLWASYDSLLKSEIGDVNHISSGPFAGSITAALFLHRFVERAKRFAHFDLYGWQPQSAPGRPAGGEPQTARAVFSFLQKTLLS